MSSFVGFVFVYTFGGGKIIVLWCCYNIEIILTLKFVICNIVVPRPIRH